MDVRVEKQRLHASIRERLSHLPAADRERESRLLCKRLEELLPSDTKTLCAFVPIQDEVNLRPFIADVLHRGIALYLPCFRTTLVFRRCTDLALLTKGTLNILEPPIDAEELDPQELEFAIVPGRAFDRQGNRLGRGNGGYDRWIALQRAANQHTAYWGVCYECQVVESVPIEPHDEPMDAVVTERGKLTKM
jgi:5-formyltetrahydrofolate cyclo-ligase